MDVLIILKTNIEKGNNYSWYALYINILNG